MDRMAGGILILVLTLSVAAAQDKGGDKSDKPAEQYKALLKEYQGASSGGALSDEERMKFVGRVYKLRYTLALRFLELASRNPKDPIAMDALIQAVWQVNNTPRPAELVGTDSAGARAFAILAVRQVFQPAHVGKEMARQVRKPAPRPFPWERATMSKVTSSAQSASGYPLDSRWTE